MTIHISREMAKKLGIATKAAPRAKPALLGEQCQDVRFRVPFPPSGNHFYTVAHGRKIISKEGRKWIKAAIESAAEADSHVAGSLEVTMWVYPPDMRRRDLDNIIKCVLDVGQKAGLFEDDSQIDVLHVYRCDPKFAGHVSVEIRGGIR